MRAAAWIAVAAVVMAAGLWADDELPPPERLVEAVRAEPQQTPPSSAAAFQAHAGGVDYKVRPRADYDITGLVVSLHDTRAWWDWMHALADDHLNVVDLCLVWGANAASGAYRAMSFSSGQFVCYFSGKDAKLFSHDNVRAISNNHLLTDAASVARLLRSARIGDQVRIRGQLVEYSHDHGFKFTRGTSLTREDTGDGACETIFVQAVETLRAAPAWPRWLFRLGVALLLAGLVKWFRTPYQSQW